MIGPERVLVDSGFFFALFNERDRHHASACQLEGWLDLAQVILPWPILYETVNTRFVRRSANLAKFEAITRAPETVLLDDSPYRVASLGGVMAHRGRPGPLSLVDAVLCNVIEDVNVPVSAILTFNDRDFLDVCLQHDVELLTAD